MKGIKICPHHMLNAFYISYFIWKIKPTLYYCIVSSLSSSHFSLWVNYQDTNFVMDFWPDPVGELFLVWVRGQQTVVSWANQVCHLFLYSCDLKLFCMFEKVQRIIFHRMWELCQVPESISTVHKLLECSSIRLFLDSLWRLEWQGGVITQTVWPAKPKMFTIWPVTGKLDDPLSKWIVIDLSLAFPGPSPAGIAHVTMKCKQRSASGVLERLCILPKRLASYLLLRVLNRKVKSGGQSFYLATMGWWI